MSNITGLSAVFPLAHPFVRAHVLKCERCQGRRKEGQRWTIGAASPLKTCRSTRQQNLDRNTMSSFSSKRNGNAFITLSTRPLLSDNIEHHPLFLNGNREHPLRVGDNGRTSNGDISVAACHAQIPYLFASLRS